MRFGCERGGLEGRLSSEAKDNEGKLETVSRKRSKFLMWDEEPIQQISWWGMECFSGGCDTEKVEDSFMVRGRKYIVGKFVMRAINQT